MAKAATVLLFVRIFVRRANFVPRPSRPCSGTGRRSCEKIGRKQKQFTQRRKDAKPAKKTRRLSLRVFAPSRLCVRLFIFSHVRMPVARVWLRRCCAVTSQHTAGQRGGFAPHRKKRTGYLKVRSTTGGMLLRGLARASIVWFLLLAASTISWGGAANAVAPPAIAPSHTRVLWPAILPQRPAHSRHPLIDDGLTHLFFPHQALEVLPLSTRVVNPGFAPSPRTVRDLLDLTQRRRE